ncbi:Replication protein A 70 kDa DNA-binding subunit B [Bienertia sinuspersici]
MKPEYKPLKELNDKTQKYKTKVKVIHKSTPQQSPNKTRYQRLLLKDDEGFTMKGALFDTDIEKYAEALERNGEYELSNATITAVPPQYASKPNEYSMIINARTEINPLSIDPTVLGPHYQSIATVPRDPFNTELVDILGVLLYVSGTKPIRRPHGGEDLVREMFLIDHSYDRPFTVSLWNELLRTQAELLDSWEESYHVVGILALTGRSYKGFTLSTTMSSVIVPNPEGVKANALRAWAADHHALLAEHRTKLIGIHSSSETASITTVQQINQRKASNTWQEERFNLKVTLPTASVENLRLYLGCSKCGRRTNATVNTTFKCPFCNVQDAQSLPRPIFKVDAVDDSGSMALTLFAREVEFLMGLSSIEMWKLKENGNEDVFAEKMHELRQKNVALQIGPTLALTTSKVLNWTVRSIAFE